MMRSLAEGAAEVDKHWIEELDGCLVCRNCESVCPSGVEYNELMAHTRSAIADSSERSSLSRESMRFGLRSILTSRSMIDLFAAMLRLGQKLGMLSMFGSLGKGASNLPDVPPASERKPLAPHHPAQGEREGEVTVLEGCVMPVFFSHVNRATVEVLQAAGRDVHVPTGATCCGALQAHNGELETARQLAKQMIELSGGSAQDMPIVFTGLRPGEKLHEELVYEHEETVDCDVDGLLVARGEQVDEGAVRYAVAGLERAARQGDDLDVRDRLASFTDCPVISTRPQLREAR